MTALPNHKYLSIHEAASLLKVSTKTLRRWEIAGKLVAARTEGGHRRYSLAKINSFKHIQKSRASKVTIIKPKIEPYLPTPKPYQAFPEAQTKPQILFPGDNLPQSIEIFQPLHFSQAKALKRIAFIGALSVFLILINSSGAVGKVSGILGLKQEKIAEKTEESRVLASRDSLLTTSLNVNVNANFQEDVDVAGNLNLSGNRISSSDDIVITSGGGGLSIGGGTPDNVDLTDDDLFVSGDLESAGDIFAVNETLAGDLDVTGDVSTSTLTINTETFDDLTGTGLTISDGNLNVALGTSVSSSEIDDDTILEVDLKASNSASNGQVLTYNSSTGGFAWANDSSGEASPWTDGGDIIYPDSATDDLAVGGTTSAAPLFFDTSAGALTITGSATVDSLTLNGTTLSSTGNLSLDRSSGSLIFTGFDCTGNNNGGKLTANASGVIQCADDETGGATSPWDVTAAVVHLITGSNNVTVGSTTNLAKLGVEGDTDEIQFLVRGNSTQTSNLVVFENSTGTDQFVLTNAGNLTLTGDATITGGDITTGALTASVFNSNATSLDIGEAATAVSIGAGSGTTTVNNNLSVTGSINGLTVSSGTISVGTWNGTAIGATFGGTGQSAVAQGDLLLGSGVNTWGRLTIGGANTVLVSNGTTASWTTVAGASCPTCVITNPTSTQTITHPAGVAFALDSDTTNSTLSSTTAGVFDINVGSTTANNTGFTLDYTSDSGVATGNDLFGQRITLTQNDLDGDLFGLVITNANTIAGAAASTDDLLFLNNADTSSADGGTVDNGLRIGSAGATITDGIDLASSNITNAINLGANDIVGTTPDINFDNFDVVGSTGNVAGGTYNSQTISSAANFTGTVTVATSVTSPTYTGTGAVTLSSAGGGGLTLDSSSGTVALAAGDALQIPSGNINSNNAAITIDSGTANQVNIGASDAFSNGTWTISGAGAVSGVTTISASGAITAATDETINGLDISAGTVTDAVNITINAGGDLTIDTIGLNDTGAGPTTAGASLVGVFDEFANSSCPSSCNVQDVLDDLDSAIGAGASKWTNSATLTYLTETTDDLAVGGTDTTAEFYIDIQNGGNVAITSSGDTENLLSVTGNSLTTGTALALSSTATAFNGELLTLSKTGASGSTAFTSDIANITYSQTFNSGGAVGDSTGNVLDISRAITTETVGTTATVSGPVARIIDSGTQTAGTLTHTGNVLFVDQNYASSTGDVLSIENAGTGDGIQLVSSSTGTLLNLDATGTGTTASGIIIENTSTGAITTALDVSDAEIVNALSIGGNAITGTNFSVAATGTITIASGQTLTIGTTSLNETTGATDTGAVLVGVFNGTLANAPTATNVQEALDAFDNAIGGGASKWSINATPTPDVLYPTTSDTTAGNDLAIGGTTITAAPFAVDVSANTVYIGDAATAGSTSLIFKSDAGGDTGTLLYNTNDQFEFSGGDVLVDQTLVLSTGAGAGISGGGLTDCDGATQKLAWDTTTAEFSCGTDGGAGSGSSKWTDNGAITYLTATADDLIVGSDDADTVAPFYIDVSANTVRIGDASVAGNAILSLYGSDGDTGNLTYNTSDQFNFTGGDVLLNQNLSLANYSITATGSRVSQTTSFDTTAASQTVDGSSMTLTNNPTTNANTVRGDYITINDAGSLANTVYGSYIDVTTANANDTAYGLAVQGDSADIRLLGGTISSNDVGITLNSGTANSITLGASDALNLSGNFVQSGSTTLTTGTGQVTLAGNVDATNGLDVTTANFTVGGSNFTVAPGTGNTTIAGTLGVTGLITASGGVTLPANQNLTLSSGTGTITQTYSNTTGSATTINATNSSAAGTNTVNGVNVALTGTATSGTNTNNALRIADITDQSNNNFTALSIGDNYDNILQYENSTFTGSIVGAGLSANRTYTLPNASGTICLDSNNCTFVSSFSVAGESGSNQTITTGDTLTIAAGTGIDTVAAATDTLTVSVQADSLDYTEFQDTLDLDAALTLNQGTNTWSQNYSGAATGLTLAATSTGTPLALTSSSTGDLLALTTTGTGTTANGITIANTSTGVITDAIDLSDAEIDNALNIGANEIEGTTATINFTNFDVSSAGNITVAASEGLDTNAAGTLELGVTNANAITVGSTGVTTTNAGALTVTQTFTGNGSVIANALLDANGQVDLGDGGDAITVLGTTVSVTSSGAGNDITLTSIDDFIFDDAQLTSAIQLTDVDTSLPNSNTGIVDAINDAWNAATGTGGVWTDSGTTVYLTNTTDELVLGGTTPLSSAKFSIDGDADQIQLILQGNGTQTANIFEIETSGAANLLTVTNAGNTAIEGTLSDISQATLVIDDDLQVNDNDILDSSGTTRVTLGATNTITGDTLVLSGTTTITAAAATTLNCADCINFDDMSDSLTLDATTTITNALTSNLNIDLTSSGDFVIQDAGTAYVTFADTSIVTFAPANAVAADGRILIDGSSTASTATDGLLDINATTVTSGFEGINMDLNITDDAGADTVIGALINVDNNATTVDDTVYGIYIDNEDQGVGSDTDLTTDAQIYLNNSEDTVPVIAGILFNSAAGGYTTGIDLSDTDIVNAINIGANPIITGNVAGTIGDSTTDSWTFTTDGTGDSEIQLPNDSIATAEILDNTITATDLAATLTFADGDYLNLSSIDQSSGVNEGFRLPSLSNTANLPAATGFIAYDTSLNLVRFYNGTSWQDFSGASTTLQQGYDNDTNGGDTIIALSTNDDSLIFRNPAASGTDSAFLLQLDQLAATGIALDINQAGTSAGIDLVFSNVGTTSDGIVISNSAGTLTDAIDISDATGITNAINLGPNDIEGTTATITFTDFQLNNDGLVTFASDGAGDQISITTPAADFQALVVDATTADSTQTAGMIDLNVDSSTTGAVLGQYLTATAIDDDAADTLYGNRTDITIQDDITASDTFYGDYIDITQNDTTPATVYGLAIVANDNGAAAVSGGILIDNLQATDIDLTDAILIRATTADSIVNGINVSDAEITNALNVGPNTITGTAYTVNSTAGNLTVQANFETANLFLSGGDTLPTSVANGNDVEIRSEGDIFLNPGGTNDVRLYANGAVVDCSGSGNGGALTTDASGIIQCSADDGGGAATTLQIAYDNDAGTDDAIILTDTTGDVVIRTIATAGAGGDTQFEVNVATATGPVIDVVNFNNTGAGVTDTTGVDLLSLAYVQATNAATISGAALDISVTQSGDAADTIRGININNITQGSSTEQGIFIGTGWDSQLAFDTSIGSEAIDLTTASGIRTTAAVDINENNTTGTVPTITWDSAETRGGLLAATLTGALGTENLIDINTTGAFTSNIIDITTATNASSGNLIDLNFGNIADTGNAIDISMGAAAVNAKGINISTAAGVRTDNAIAITENNTTGTVPSIQWDSAETRGGLLDANITGALGTENLIDITASAAFTSNLLDLNVGAAAATGDVINIDINSTATGSQAFVLTDAAANTVDLFDISSTGITTGRIADINAATNTFSSGTLLNLSTTSTGLTGTSTTGSLLNLSSTGVTTSSFVGNLAYIGLDQTSGTTAGNLLTININSGATTTGDLFQVQDASSDLFRVNESIITSALPHEFTAAGDVSIAYDIQFTNQTSSSIKSKAPLIFDIGESFESNTATFNIYNAGGVVIDGVTDANTSTTGVFDLNVSSSTTSNVGFNVDYTSANGVTAAADLFAGMINLTQNDADGDLFGLDINAPLQSGTTGAIEALLRLRQLDTTASNTTTVESGLTIDAAGSSPLTNAISITNTGTSSAITNAISIADTTGTIADAIDLSGTFTNLIDAPNFDVNNAGNITVAANEGIDTNAAGTLEVGDVTATTVSIGSTAATTLNLGAGGALTRGINIGTGTGADTINIGTGATTADAIAFGNVTAGVATTFTVNSGAQTATPVTFDLDEVTSATALDLSVDALTTGTGLLIDDGTAAGLSSGTLLQVQSATTDTTAITDGMLAYFNWSGSATKSGDLVRINIGSGGNVTNLFNVTDNGSSIFSVAETGITSAQPHSFTAAGDVTIAYDLVFSNQTASTIRASGPLTIEQGESSENNNLTITTYGNGKVIVNGGFSINSQETLPVDDTTPSVGGASFYLENNTVNTVVTNFDDGTAGQIIVIEVTDTEIDFDCSANANFNCGSTDLTTAAGDVLTWIYDGTQWNMISYMDNAIDHNGTDLAEWFPTIGEIQAGEVVSIDNSEPVKVQKSVQSDDQRVIGVVSTQPGIILGQEEEGVPAALVALAGRVPVKIDPSSEPIANGDLIGASSSLGLARKVTGGWVVGRALETWTPGSGQETVTIFVNPIYVNETQFAVTDYENRIVNLENNLTLLQSQLELGQEASSSASFTDLTVSDINVLGDTVLGDTVVNGKLNVGTLTFDNVEQSINAVGTLKIQDMALGNIEFLGGLITFDTEGNIVAKEVTAEKFNVNGASAGIGTLPSGEKEIFVETTVVTENSLVFLTPKRALAFPIAVTEKEEGVGFWVELPAAQSLDTDFDWFIVDKLSATEQ